MRISIGLCRGEKSDEVAFHVVMSCGFDAGRGGIARDGAAAGAAPDQVEEDWQVVVANPDPLAVGPQITTMHEPEFGSRGSVRHLLSELPRLSQLEPGRLQVKAYGPAPDACHKLLLARLGHPGYGVCETKGETISWTQRMSLSGGSLNFNVVNGSQRPGASSARARDARCQHDQHAFRPERLQARLFGLQVGRELAVQPGHLHDPCFRSATTAAAS